MSIRVNLNDEEQELFIKYVEYERLHAATDPGRGVLTRAALDKLRTKLGDIKASKEEPKS